MSCFLKRGGGGRNFSELATIHEILWRCQGDISVCHASARDELFLVLLTFTTITPYLLPLSSG